MELTQEELQGFLDLIDGHLRRGGLDALPLSVKLLNSLNLARPLETSEEVQTGTQTK